MESACFFESPKYATSGVLQSPTGNWKGFDASDAGLWAGTYAMENEAEYWAEGVQSFFDTNLSDDLQHNDIDSRTELEAYDPVLFALIVEIHGVPDWRPRCP